MKAATPFPDSYWVLPGLFLAGEYPGAPEENLARQKLQKLIRAGIEVFIDLTVEGELVPYHSWLYDEAAGYSSPVEYQRFPVRDYSTPSYAEMVRILDTIDQSVQSGEKVYLHCWGGIGRTGTVVGCYLVRHGKTSEQALQALADLRSKTPDGWRRSPESDEQIAMVNSWRQNE